MVWSNWQRIVPINYIAAVTSAADHDDTTVVLTVRFGGSLSSGKRSSTDTLPVCTLDSKRGMLASRSLACGAHSVSTDIVFVTAQRHRNSAAIGPADDEVTTRGRRRPLLCRQLTGTGSVCHHQKHASGRFAGRSYPTLYCCGGVRALPMA